MLGFTDSGMRSSYHVYVEIDCFWFGPLFWAWVLCTVQQIQFLVFLSSPLIDREIYLEKIYIVLSGPQAQ